MFETYRKGQSARSQRYKIIKFCETFKTYCLKLISNTIEISTTARGTFNKPSFFELSVMLKAEFTHNTHLFSQEKVETSNCPN